MAKQSARAKPADTHIDGAINDCAINEMIPVVETIQAFAREIAEMSEQALVRTSQHVEKLRKAHRIEEAAAIQADFLKEAMEHAVQHTRKYIEMLATFPHELVWPVSAAVEMAQAARHATAAKVERLTAVVRND
jgi:Phasin protein